MYFEGVHLTDHEASSPMSSPSSTPRAVLALCLGNICRSPIAEGMLRVHLERAGLSIEVDSAGTSGYHEGEAPDTRSVAIMSTHGHDISSQRSRQLTLEDFKRFDLIIAMDQSNLRQARRLAPNPECAEKVYLLLDDGAEVPDPYYGGSRGFEHVYQLINHAAERWVRSWVQGDMAPHS